MVCPQEITLRADSMYHIINELLAVFITIFMIFQGISAAGLTDP